MSNENPGIIRNIFTTLKKVFGNSKPQEFETRQSIEQALAAANRQPAAPPVLNPTLISNKGTPLGVFSDKGNGPSYHNYMERERARQNRYAIFDKMDSDLLASALDVYANEATQKNQDGVIVSVHCQSKYIEDELMDMLSVTGINNYKSWGIIRDMCKYGDRFESVQIDSRRGITKLSTLDNRSVYRVEKNGEHLGYLQDLDVLKKQYATYIGNTSLQSPYLDMAAILQPYMDKDVFSMASDENGNSNSIPFAKYELMHFRLRGASSQDSYGKSVLDAAVDIWKKVDLLTDSLIIYRLNRAPSRMVFYVDVGNSQGAEIENIIMNQINKVNKKEFFDQSGKVNSRALLLDMNSNIYIPVGKNSQSSKVDMLQGASNMGDIEDLTYLNNRLFSAIRVPKSFLGFDGETQGKGMLSQQNVSFGKALQNIQEDFLEIIKDLCVIHLAVKGISTERDLRSFDLVMSRPSYIEEKARIEVESELLSLASSYRDMKVNTKWIFKHIMRRTDAEIEQMFQPDPLNQAEGGLGDMGGGLGGPSLDMGSGLDLGAGAPPPDIAGQSPMDSNAPLPTNAGPQQSAPMPSEPLMQGRTYNGQVFFEQDVSTIHVKVSCRKPLQSMQEYIPLIEDCRNERRKLGLMD